MCDRAGANCHSCHVPKRCVRHGCQIDTRGEACLHRASFGFQANRFQCSDPVTLPVESPVAEGPGMILVATRTSGINVTQRVINRWTAFS